MSSKRELREQIALLRGDVEAWRRTAERFAVSRDKAVSERDAVFGDLVTTREQRDDARDELAQAIAEREEMAEEVVAVRAELARAQYQDREELMEARARVTELEAAILDHATTEPEATPEPRPFRVGDRVRVAEGATFKGGSSGPPEPSSAGGRVGVVRMVWGDGDLTIDTSTGRDTVVSPEFCTLIEDESEAVLPLPEGYTFTAPESNVPAPPEPTRAGVTLHTHGGRELWIPSEESVDVEVDNGLLWLTTGISGATVAYVNPAAIVAAVVTR